MVMSVLKCAYVDDADITKVAQRCEVLGLSQSIEIAAAECQSAKVFVNGGKKRLGAGKPRVIDEREM